jgi:hypothetical protein
LDMGLTLASIMDASSLVEFCYPLALGTVCDWGMFWRLLVEFLSDVSVITITHQEHLLLCSFGKDITVNIHTHLKQ